MAGMDGWYESLDRPGWQPPDAAFGPVWIVLYITIIVAAWLVWRRVGLSTALVPWAVQLVLNAGWSVVFFGLEEPGWAVLEIGALLLAIVWTMATFWRIHRIAAVILVPYLAWVGFAAALTVYIAMNN